MTGAQRWVKSSRSQSLQNCVEVTTTLDALRDSKNRSGPTLRVDVSEFVRAIKAGHFDR
jgi:hypothetical protein